MFFFFFPPATHSATIVFEVWLQWIFEGWLSPDLCRSHSTSLCSWCTGRNCCGSLNMPFPGRAMWLGASLSCWYPTLQTKYQPIRAVRKLLPCGIIELHGTWKAMLCLMVERCLFLLAKVHIFVTAFDGFSAGDLADCFLSYKGEILFIPQVNL